jgi:hypothetical protein
MVRMRMSSGLRLTVVLVVSIVGACSDSTSGPAPSGREPGAPDSMKEQETQPVSSAFVWFDQDVVLEGFFRTEPVYFDPGELALVPAPGKPWVPEPAPPDAHEPGDVLPVEYWVDAQAVRPLVDSGRLEPAAAVDSLTARVSIAASGQLDVAWTGAAEGLLALRAGTIRRGQECFEYAVEAPTDEPRAFVRGGVPAPRKDSLTLRFSDYVDSNVATKLTIHMPEQGIIFCERDPQGGLTMAPGRIAAAALSPPR